MDSLGSSFNPNKHLKEEFVSNLTGSSMLEIFSLSTIVPVVMVLRHSVDSNCLNENPLKKRNGAIIDLKNLRAYVVALLKDFLCIFLPMLVFFTVLAEWIHTFAIVLIFLLLFTILGKRFQSSSFSGGSPSSRTFISSYRICMMLVTCLCILAVDFKIFPRSFAKTETYGTSLMDIGVGSFVLANAIVSRQARIVMSMKWTTALQSTSPLILLGVGRLVFTSGVDYQVHVGEYGLHWNFFFTLAAVSILASIINIPTRYCGVLGSLILVGYQICLLCGLSIYLLSDKREMNIISQNKEGIFSIFGYWGLYLVGVQLGNYLFFGKNPTATLRGNKWAMMRVWVLSIVFWLITILLDMHVERVSRRLCNLAYITLVLAQNLQVLGILMLSDYIPGSKISVLEEAFNQNLLGAFLLANVLTGIVNLSVDTLSASPITALLTLIVYAVSLSAAVGVAYFCGIKFKFW